MTRAAPSTRSDNAPASAAAAAVRPGKVRVLMLINRVTRGGGAERMMVMLATHLPPERYDVTVATTRPASGPLLDELLAHGIPHLSVARRGRLDLAPLRRLVAFMRRERIDVVHAHMFGSNFWGSILGRLARVPVVVAHEHTWSYEGQRLRRFVDGHVTGRLADAFVAVSARDRDRMIELEGVPSEKILVLPNPYVHRPPGPRDIRRDLGIAPDAPLVATVAVLRPQKALDVLIEAFSHVAAELPDARLVIGGDGPCRDGLERLAQRLGLSSRVHFLGWCDDVGGVLRAADVAAMSSDYEGAPLFALECMAHHTPLVSTDVGNVADLLGDGDAVVTVPPREPVALGRALTALLTDPDRRVRQAAAAAERLRPYEVQNVVREFAGMYERLLGLSGDTRPWHRRTARFLTRVGG